MRRSGLRVTGMWGLQGSPGFESVRACVCVRETYECENSEGTERSGPRINYPIKITSRGKTLKRSHHN